MALKQVHNQPTSASAAETTSASQTQAFLCSAMEYTQGLSGARIHLPVLTEEERQSSLGVSISHAVALFSSMSQQLMKERTKNQEHSSTSCDTKDKTGESSTSQQPSSAYASTASASLGAPPLPAHLPSGTKASSAPPGETNSNDNRRNLRVNCSSSSYRQAHNDRYSPVARPQRYPPAEGNPPEKTNMHCEQPQQTQTARDHGKHAIFGAVKSATKCQNVLTYCKSADLYIYTGIVLLLFCASEAHGLRRSVSS